MAISVPVDLKGSSIALRHSENTLYSWRFLRTLSKKMHSKHHQFPKNLDIRQLKKVKTLTDFDDYFTSKINGFEDAEDYYLKASSKQFIPNISKLSEKTGINRQTLLSYMYNLEEAGLIKNLHRNSKGISLLQKPEKIFLENTNLAYAVSAEKPDKGSLRESFFYNQLSYKHTHGKIHLHLSF